MPDGLLRPMVAPSRFTVPGLRKACHWLELDNTLFNLEFMPLTLNQKKSAKVGQRQLDLARKWHKAGLLSDECLRAVLAVSAIK